MSNFLKINNLTKLFDGVVALDQFSCSVNRGKIVGLIGPNGAGKTTLFNIVTGFLQCDKGEIHFNNKNITGMPPHNILSLGISRTFQDLRLIRHLTVLDNVMLTFYGNPGENISSNFYKNKRVKLVEKENKERAMHLLKETSIKDKVHHLANDLSYGQQKLLSLICCLASDADLLLLDEPVAGINPEMIEKILSIIKQLHQKGKSIIFIEHNIDVVMQICDRVIFMDAGKKVCEGTPYEVRNNPKVIDAYID